MQKAGGMRGWRACLRALPWWLLAALASCGGGTTQIEPFHPRQMIFLGDENVGLLPDGRRHAINALDVNGVFECGALPIWTQQLAANFGITVDNCGSGTTGITRAIPNGKAADLEAQVSAQLALGVTSKDLFVVMVGMNDIIELYEQFPNRSEADITNEVRARGSFVAAQVSRVLAAGARAIVSTVHDLSQTPYAYAQRAANNDTDRQALISRLTAAYNARVRVDIKPLDGRLWGLVLADDDTLALVKSPNNYGLTNVTTAACAVAPPDCTTTTLIPGANAATFLWADDRRFGAVLHNLLATEAITRARNNPF